MSLSFKTIEIRPYTTLYGLKGSVELYKATWPNGKEEYSVMCHGAHGSASRHTAETLHEAETKMNLQVRRCEDTDPCEQCCGAGHFITNDDEDFVDCDACEGQGFFDRDGRPTWA